MISFKDKILLITGGTGSFGNAVLRRFLTTDIVEIRILSRDEKKQDDMRHTYQELYEYPKSCGLQRNVCRTGICHGRGSAADGAVLRDR